MKLKSMISWALIFSFTLLLFQPLMIARETESATSKAQAAQLNEKYQRINKDLQNYLQKSRTAKKPLQVKKAKAEQDLMFDPNSEDMSAQDGGDNGDQSDGGTDSTPTSDTVSTPTTATTDTITSVLPNVGVLLQSASTAILGDIIPITVAVSIKGDANTSIDKVNLSIQDQTGKTYLKDSFTNYKNLTQFTFTYFWDTQLAETKADSADTKHKIIVEAYTKNGDQYNLFQSPITADIKVSEDSGIDISKHGFWNGFLKEDGSLDSGWLKKLGCSSKDDCKTKDQIRSHISSAINSSDFSLQISQSTSKFSLYDANELAGSFTRYVHQLEKNAPSKDQDISMLTGYGIAMGDLISFVDAKIDTVRGFQGPNKIPDDILIAPETLTVFKALNENSIKIASYNIQSSSELKSSPLWQNLVKYVSDNISKESFDQLKSIDDLNLPNGSKLQTRIRPNKAWAADTTAIEGLIATVYDVLSSYKQPTNWSIDTAVANANLSLDANGIGVGSVNATAPWVARFLQRVPLFGRLSQAITKYWKVAGYLTRLDNQNLNKKTLAIPYIEHAHAALDPTALATATGQLVSGVWVWFSGGVKKVLGSAGTFTVDSATAIGGGIVSAFTATSCPPMSLSFGGIVNGVKSAVTGSANNTLDPFSWALCYILKFAYDVAALVYRFSFCLMFKSIEPGTGTGAQCNFDPAR